MKNNIYVIILNYNNEKDTLECIDSIKKITKHSIKIILVDNNSSPQCINTLKKSISNDILFVENDKNGGYAQGNNIGIKLAIKLQARYIAIINNDVIVNEDSLNDCIKILEHYPSVAIASPTIIDYTTHKIQSSGAIVDMLRIKSKSINYGKEYKKLNKRLLCDYVGGACIVFRTELIEKIGYLPEEYFLFWEETEWCLKAKKLGLKCVCTLNNYVLHKESATIKKNNTNKQKFLERNRILFIKRNAPNKISYVLSLIYILFSAIIKGLLINKKYLNYINWYIEGMKL